jgi:hypothetical protein
MSGVGRKPRGSRADPGTASHVSEYKSLLRRVLDNRPSGSRLRLALALGKNRSFVSQICNPAYPTPIPAGHVETILEICHFAPEERRRFLALYAAAHPRSVGLVGPVQRSTRTTTLVVPDLGSAARNRELDAAIGELVRRLARVLAPGDDPGRGRRISASTGPARAARASGRRASVSAQRHDEEENP